MLGRHNTLETPNTLFNSKGAIIKYMAAEKQKEISWRAAEYDHSTRSLLWYFWLIAIVVSLAAFAFWQRNFFFGVFVILAGTMIAFFSRRRPQVFEFKISENGVFVSDKISFDYDDLESFFVRDRPGHLDEIVLKKKTRINPFVKIPIDSKLAEKAKEILAEKIPEAEHEDSIIDIISDRLGI